MADFNPSIPDREPNLFVNRSQGARGAGNIPLKEPVVGEPKLQKATDPLNALFSNIAGVTESAIAGVDQVIKSDIESSLAAEVDRTRESLGVGSTAAEMLANNDVEIPEPLQQDVDRLGALKQSFDTGNLTSAHYWGKLEVASKQMRARYPGYRDFIDSTMSKLTGGVPANRIAASLIQEAESSRSERDNLLDYAIKKGYINSAEYERRVSNGQDFTLAELRHRISSFASIEQQINHEKNKLALAAAQGQANDRQASQVARQIAYSAVNAQLGQLQNVVGGSWQKIEELRARSRSGEKGILTFTPEEEQQLRIQVNMVKQQLLTSFNQAMFQSFNDDPTKSIAALTNPNDLAQIRQEVEATIDNYFEDITNERFGLASLNAAVVDSITNGSSAQIMLNQEIAKYSALRKSLGPELLNAILSKNETGLNQLNQIITSIKLGETFTNSGSSSLKETISRVADEQGVNDPRALESLVDVPLEVLTDENIPVEAINSLTNKFFGEDNRNFITSLQKDEQLIVWNKMTHPKVAEKYVEEKGKGNTDIFNKYRDWVFHSFNALFRQEAQDATNIAVNRKNISISYNPNTHQFSIGGKRTGPGRFVTDLSSGRLADAVTDFTENFVLEPISINAVDRFNKGIFGIVNVLKAEGMSNDEINTELATTFEFVGLNINQPNQGSTMDTLFSLLYENISKASPIDIIQKTTQAITDRPITSLSVNTEEEKKEAREKLRQFLRPDIGLEEFSSDILKLFQ